MKDGQLENNIISLHTRGWSIRRLAIEFKISRGRIRRIIEDNTRKRCGDISHQEKHVKRASKLDPYKDQIHEILDTYKDPVVTNRRVYEMIKEKGYEGGETILCDYLSGIRGKKPSEP